MIYTHFKFSKTLPPINENYGLGARLENLKICRGKWQEKTKPQANTEESDHVEKHKGSLKDY